MDADVVIPEINVGPINIEESRQPSSPYHGSTTPPAKQLCRMYSNGKTLELMQQHLNLFCESQSILPNLHSSTAWKQWFEAKGMFKGDGQSVSFALCMGGLNPFTHEKTQFSMWQIFIVPLNLPLSLGIKPGAMYLTGIIHGPNETKNMDPYLDIFVDDIMDLKDITK